MKPALGLKRGIADRIAESIAVKQALLESDSFLSLVGEVAHIIAKSLHDKGKVFFFGNGGSAADAQHLAAELVGRYMRERRALPALALTANASCVTAIANDYGYDLVFARQLEAIGARGDIAIGISTSGNSRNVVRAVEAAKEKGMITVAMTGSDGGQLKPLVDYCLCVASDRTARIQESHILIGHILCEIVEEELFNDGHIS
jgi:D-sedoheptulose 7-phosphate isomerase